MASAIASTSSYIFPTCSSHFSHSTLIPQHPQLEQANDQEDSEEEDSEGEEKDVQPRDKHDQGLREEEEGQELKRSNSTKRKGKNWVCEYQGCDKVYTRRTRLEEHERTHTGEVSPLSYPILKLSFTFVRLSLTMLNPTPCSVPSNVPNAPLASRGIPISKHT